MMFLPKHSSSPTRKGPSTTLTTPVARARLLLQGIIRLTKTMMSARLWLQRGHRTQLALIKQEVIALPFLPPILASIAIQGSPVRLMMMRTNKSVCTRSIKASRLKLRSLRRSRSLRIPMSSELNPGHSKWLSRSKTSSSTTTIKTRPGPMKNSSGTATLIESRTGASISRTSPGLARIISREPRIVT